MVQNEKEPHRITVARISLDQDLSVSKKDKESSQKEANDLEHEPQFSKVRDLEERLQEQNIQNLIKLNEKDQMIANLRKKITKKIFVIDDLTNNL